MSYLAHTLDGTDVNPGAGGATTPRVWKWDWWGTWSYGGRKVSTKYYGRPIMSYNVKKYEI